MQAISSLSNAKNFLNFALQSNMKHQPSQLSNQNLPEDWLAGESLDIPKERKCQTGSSHKNMECLLAWCNKPIYRINQY